MAHIEKRGPSRYRVRYRDPNGKERSRTFKRNGDAERFRATVEASMIKGDWINPDRGKITLEEWAWAWFATTEGLKESGRERNRSYLRTHVISCFGRRTIASIATDEVQEWVNQLNKRRKPATVKLAHGIFFRLMQAAVEQARIPTNPCSGIRLLPIDHEEMRFLLPHEVARLAESIHPRYRAYVLVQAYGGLRCGEMAALKSAQVDLARGHIEVVASVTEVGGRLVWGPPKTRRGRRFVVLPNEVVRELAHHLDNWAGEQTVFGAPQGGTIRAASWRRRFWHPAVKKAGLSPLRPYDLRHTAIAFWIRAGGNTLEISRRAGHSSVAFTLDRYGHLFPEADTELSERLSGLYRAPGLTVLPSIEPEKTSAAASSRPEGSVITFRDQQEEPVTSDDGGGASWNRTSDLSIISAAL
jgi:integrase